MMFWKEKERKGQVLPPSPIDPNMVPMWPAFQPPSIYPLT